MAVIQDLMFKDQRTSSNIKGYYKLGYSTNDSDHYHNFAANPPTGTDPGTPIGSGTIAFSQVDEAGEQSLFDANLNHGENALTPLSGAFAWSQTAFARPVPGIAFDLEFGYSSALPTQASADQTSDPYDERVLGPQWRQTFDIRVVDGITQNELDVVKWDGSIEAWTRTNQYAALSTKHHEYRGELVQFTTTAEVQWITPDRLIYLFRDPGDGTGMAGRLEQISDFNSNVVSLQWDEDALVVTNVIDTAGGSYSFNYDFTKYLLTNVTFGAWQVNFTYDTTGRLFSKTLTNTAGLYTPVSNTWQFQYNTNGLLSQIIDPRGNTNLLVQYDQYGRQTNEVDALGRANRTEYGTPGLWQIRHTDPTTNYWIETYDPKGHILAQQDPLTNTTSYTYDTNGNRTSITEPLGWQTFFGYDSRANVIAKTNALNEVTTWVIHPFFNKAIQQVTPQPINVNGSPTWTNFYAYDAGGNLTNHSDGLGTLVNYTYYTNGLVSSSTDANGNTTQFKYDTNGFLHTQTDPATNTTTFTRNDVGWNMREVNALSQPTSYAYDLNGNITRKRDALSRVFNRTNDPNGNLLGATDGKGFATTYAYDAANQRTNMTDRTGTNKWAFFYTSRGKLDHLTDPLNHSTTNFYDTANRLFAIGDPLGNFITNQFDPNGNVIFFFDKLGRRWSKTYDHLNRVVTESNPLGDTKRTVYDVADRIQQLFSPSGYPSTHQYDGRGRLTEWTDPQNFPWHYDYDGVGNITNITDALQGHYIMAYGNRNERTLERNQDGFEWHYTYDELLRLKTETNANLIVRTRTYDDGDRLTVVDFSTGRQDILDYDDNDNLRSLSRDDSLGDTTTQFVYDSLDRIQEEDDPNGQTVLYGHDPLGRVTSITYPGNKTLTQFYDALGRLTNQVDWANRQVTYTYDAADRLRSRVYPNGVVQTNNFDDAGRITGLAYSSASANSNAINIALNYAYDHNGNKTGQSEVGTFAWPLPSLSDQTSQFTASGRITNRVDALNSTNNFTYQYDATGNMTNAASPVQNFALTYDEDNRTTSLQWIAGPSTNETILNRYDALGRRISKTVSGNETDYVLDLSGGMERILCDLDGSGNIIAWYVHGPDLCYKVDTTNGLICYHADATANIIALTDGNTNLVAQYAYTPYGHTLGSTNFPAQIANPYLFVGSQGVMNEFPEFAGTAPDPDLYFMRSRYYSADAGIFLSTDSLKRIGSGWTPILYDYAAGNPLAYTDPTGQNPWLAAFALGWLGGSVEGVTEKAAEQLTVDLSSSGGRDVQIEEVAFRLKALHVTVKHGGELIEGGASLGGVGVAYFLGDQLANYTTDPIWDFSKFLVDSVGNAGAAIGQQLHKELFGQGQSGQSSTILYSSTAGTAPMAGLNSAQSFQAQSSLPAMQMSATNQSISTRTVSAGATANNVSAATTARPSAPSIGGTTAGGGSTTTYTVRAGDTLGNIGYANGTTATAIGAANGIQNLNLIYPGQVLTIPHR